MAFIPAPNIIETEFRYLLAGQQIENRVMIDNLAPVTAGDLSAVAEAAWNWAELTLLPHLSNTLLLRETVATDLTTNEGGQFVYAPDTTTTGEVTGSCLPNECAFCISLRSDSRGRSARGRFYVPAIPVGAMVDANTMGSSSVNVLVDDLQALINAFTTLGKPIVVVSYRHNKVVRPGGPVYFPVVSATATDAIIDSQRRRKPGVGT